MIISEYSKAEPGPTCRIAASLNEPASWRAVSTDTFEGVLEEHLCPKCATLWHHAKGLAIRPQLGC
jgi:hypothetical protein